MIERLGMATYLRGFEMANMTGRTFSVLKLSLLTLVSVGLVLVMSCGGGKKPPDEQPTTIPSATETPAPAPTSPAGPGIQPSATPSETRGPSSDTTVGQIARFRTEETVEERSLAITDLVSQGLSIGVVDEAGGRLNADVPFSDIALTPADIDAYAAMPAGANYRTVSELVEFLDEFGVELDSTGRAITTDDFLADLQAYVDWSFANQEDRRAALGLLIGSGHLMQMPSSSPVLHANYAMSPVAGLMVISDVLLGISEEHFVSHNVGTATFVSYSPANGDQVDRIRGIITTIKPYLGKFEKVWPGFTAWYERARKILAGYNLGDHLAVRLTDRAGITGETVAADSVIRSIVYKQAGVQQHFTPIVAVPSSSGTEVSLLTGIDTAFTLNLIGGYDPAAVSSAPLYPDADAVLSASLSQSASVDRSGHRLLLIAKNPTEAICTLESKDASNPAPRGALLHISATLNVPDLIKKVDEQRWWLETASKFWGMGLTWTELKESLSWVQDSIKPTPWLVTVEFAPKSAELKIETSPEPASTVDLVELRATKPDGSAYPIHAADKWRFVWDFGDGKPFRETASNSTERLYKNIGTYEVVVRLLNEGGGLVAAGKTTVTVSSRGEMRLSPATSEMEGGRSRTFTVIHPDAPERATYTWDFGDGSKNIVQPRVLGIDGANPSQTHTFANKEGLHNYEIRVVATNTDTGKVTGEALATVKVTSRTEMTIFPPNVDRFTDRAVDLEARYGTVPDNALYEWDFDDGNPVVKVTGSNKVSHTWASAGIYTVRVVLKDGDTGVVWADAEMTAEVTLWADWVYENALIKNNILSVQLCADTEFVRLNSEPYDYQSFGNCWWNYGMSQDSAATDFAKIKWAGRRFEIDIDRTWTVTGSGTRTLKQNISGTFTHDLEVLTSLVIDYERISTAPNGDTQTWKSSLVLQNVPIALGGSTSFSTTLIGSQIDQYVDDSSLKYEQSCDPASICNESRRLASVDWNSQTNPRLTIRFEWRDPG